MNCAIQGCDGTARWSVGAKLWAIGCSKITSPPLAMYTPLVVCEHHKTSPAHPAPEFFTAEARSRIDAEMERLGKVLPDYSGAEWLFTALPTPCSCKQSDAWRCAVDQRLSTVTCRCACHRSRPD